MKARLDSHERALTLPLLRALPPALPAAHPAAWLATWFGAGLLPRAPGTWGSAAALPFAWVIAEAGGAAWLLAAVAVVFALGVWSAGVYAAADGGGDPGPVVIDEVAGQWLVLVVAAPDWRMYILGFLLFRLVDITKPWPAGWADRNLKGGFGIMLDDVLAAPYAMAVLYGAGLWMNG